MLNCPILRDKYFTHLYYLITNEDSWCQILTIIFDIKILSGTSSLARGLTGYIDSLMGDRMAYALREAFPINIGFLAPYPDFLAFAFVLVVAGCLSIGVKESSWLNIIFTTVNMLTIVIMIVAGSMRGNLRDNSIFC